MRKHNSMIHPFTIEDFKHMTIETLKACTLSSDELKAYIIYAITEHDGKLEDVYSISTNRNENRNCENLQKIAGSICEHCYVTDYAYRTSLMKKLQKNQYVFTTYKLTENDIPFLPYEFIRFESFGDLNNTIQVWNYCMIAKVNKHAHCALWSKIPQIIKTAFKFYGNIKPENMRMVYSYLFMNADKIGDMNAFKAFINREYPFIDKVFIVYDYTFAFENNVTINCARKCNSCRNSCYLKNDTFFIAESEKHSTAIAKKQTESTLKKIGRINRELFITESSNTGYYEYRMTGKAFIEMLNDSDDDDTANRIAYQTGKTNYHVSINLYGNGDIVKIALSPAC